MPWSPSFADAVSDPRLDPFRDRVAVATRFGEPAGHILVETDYLADKLSGALWWRRWSRSVEYAVVHPRLGTPTTPYWVLPAEIDAHVTAWAAGTYTEGGTTYGLTWLSAEESERLHRKLFGHQH